MQAAANLKSNAAHGPTGSSGQGVARRIPLSAWYMLFVLSLVNMFNALDKVILSMLVEPIKHEFHLSDTQMGLIAGLALAIFNAGAMVPVGMLADRVNRRNLISVCLCIWSAATALGGLATHWVQLLLSRIVVGAGEAGGGPPSLSMIADRFPPEKRTTAASLFYVTASIGGTLAVGVGGWIATHYGWRTTLIAAGVPGLALAALLFLTVREPQRGQFDQQRTETRASFGEVLRYMLARRSLFHLGVAICLVSFVISAIGTWAPAFFVRTHGLKLDQIGFFLSAAHVVGFFGAIGGGMLADRLALRDKRWWCWLVAIGLGCTALSILAFTMATSQTATLLAFALYTLAISFWYGPSYGTVQSLVRPHMRSTATAMLYMGGNIIGYGLGTQSVGLLSDAFKTSLGGDALRFALMPLIGVAVWAMCHFLIAARSLRHDFAAVQEQA